MINKKNEDWEIKEMEQNLCNFHRRLPSVKS